MMMMMNVSNVTCAGVDVISAETIMNPVQAIDDGSKGKSIVRSPEVVAFLFSVRYGIMYDCFDSFLIHSCCQLNL